MEGIIRTSLEGLHEGSNRFNPKYPKKKSLILVVRKQKPRCDATYLGNWRTGLGHDVVGIGQKEAMP